MKDTAQKFYRHIRSVQDALHLIIDDLTNRARTHDASKFQDDEIEGYARFEMIPQGLEYGSPEHQTMMKAILTDNDCFERHAERNDHHPEHYADVQKMPFTAIQEMVADWAGAHLSYGNTGSWPQSVEDNIAKHNFSEGQIWLIYQVAAFLMNHIGVLGENITENCPKLGVYPKGIFFSIDDDTALQNLQALKSELKDGVTFKQAVQRAKESSDQDTETRKS